MGEVYRALDERLGREVAIKLLKSSGGGSTDRQVRLLREAQAAGALNHPSIVTVYDVGTWEDRPFLVMELVEGRRFSDLKNVSPSEALSLCAQAADALAVAHARGILHRDVKSDNLMVLPDGRVKVLDFGLAKLSTGGTSSSGASPSDSSASNDTQSADPLGETIAPSSSGSGSAPTTPMSSPSPLGVSLTRVGDVIGTPAYMAPEQADGRPADARSEVFSLAVVLYELLVGRRPFVGATIGETLELVRTRDPVPPSVAAGKPALRPLDALVMRALAKSPDARPADMRELAAGLRRVAAPASRARLAALGVALAVVATAGALTLRSRERPPAAKSDLRPQNIHRLTRQEGCEEFPAFSADSRAVLYDATVGSDYSLFRIPVEGGEPVRLTTVDGWDLAPAVSPDGAQVAFLRKGDGPMATWLAPLAHTDQARSFGAGGMRPAWSKDGRFVWTGGGKGMVRRDATTGAAVRTIAPPEDERPLMLRELPDGRVLVLFLPRAGTATADAVGIYGAHSDQVQWLLKGDLEEVLAPLPSGDEVVIARRTASENIELVGVPLAGGAPRTLAMGDVAPRKGLAFAPDSSHLVWSNCRQATGLAVLDHDNAGGLRLTDLGQNDWLDIEPTLIPGTNDLLVISDRSGNTEVWRLDRNNRRPATTLGVGKDSSTLAVSPDGKQLAFGNDAGYWVAPLDGKGEAKKLAAPASDSPPSFRRDGRSIFFESVDEAKQPRIGEVPVGGGAPRFILTHARAPAASPTEDVLAYLEQTEAGSVPRLYDLRTRQRRSLAPSLEARTWTGLRFSSDGNQLLLLRNSGELAVIDVHGGSVKVQFDAGADQILGGAFVGKEIIVGRSVWRGDLWIASLSR
jgi:serine/threonine protein kinase/Tol biopolymer transport system component